jgi:hypothetical protein
MYWFAYIGILFLGLLLLRSIADSDIDRNKRAAVSSIRGMLKDNGLASSVIHDYVLIQDKNSKPLRLYTGGLGRPTSWVSLNGTVEELPTAEVVLTLAAVFLLEAHASGEVQLKLPPPVANADFVYNTLVTSVSALGYGEHTVEEIGGVFIHLEVREGRFWATLRRIRAPMTNG